MTTQRTTKPRISRRERADCYYFADDHTEELIGQHYEVMLAKYGPEEAESIFWNLCKVNHGKGKPMLRWLEERHPLTRPALTVLEGGLLRDLPKDRDPAEARRQLERETREQRRQDFFADFLVEG